MGLFGRSLVEVGPKLPACWLCRDVSFPTPRGGQGTAPPGAHRKQNHEGNGALDPSRGAASPVSELQRLLIVLALQTEAGSFPRTLQGIPDRSGKSGVTELPGGAVLCSFFLPRSLEGPTFPLKGSKTGSSRPLPWSCSPSWKVCHFAVSPPSGGNLRAARTCPARPQKSSSISSAEGGHGACGWSPAVGAAASLTSWSR